jgi:hypothetical protein
VYFSLPGISLADRGAVNPELGNRRHIASYRPP